MAYRHLDQLTDSAFEFLDRLITPTIEKTTISKKIILSLKILQEWGCLEETKSTKTIKEYKVEVAKVLTCSYSNAVRIYNQLRGEGLISSKQVGNYGSRVWLTPTGVQRLQDSI